MRRAVKASAAGLMAIVIGVTGCSSKHDPKPAEYTNVTQPRQIGEHVFVTGPQVHRDMKAAPDTSAKSPQMPLTRPLAPVQHLTPDGPLKAPVKLEFKLDQAVPAGSMVVMATAESPTGPWTLTESQLSPDRKSAFVEAPHLSWWVPLVVDLQALVKAINDDFYGGLSGNLTTQADEPECQDKKKADEGFSISSEGKIALMWCFGMQDGKRVLKVVNRMRYPLQLDRSGLGDPIRKGFVLEFQQLARIGSGEQTIIFPFEEIVFPADLKPAQNGKLHAEFSGWAFTFAQLETTATLLLNIASRGKASAMEKGLTVSRYTEIAAKVNELLMIPDCLAAANPKDFNAGKLIGACFKDEWIKEAFGWKSYLLVPLMTFGPLLEFLRSSFNAVFDIMNGRAKYQITLRREESLDLRGFVGQWEFNCPLVATPRFLTIRTNGTADWVDGEALWRLRLYRTGSELYGKVVSQVNGIDRIGFVVHVVKQGPDVVELAAEGLYDLFYRPQSQAWRDAGASC
ncbi:hypothetical protein ABZ570_32045 [Micromonospora sp. NPDC007271]|uniref:hypothetical protein n=1 Tax=Micromonospora sp. NPDC007271 TaxID=3154587 RepID=UPI0033E572F8